MFVTVNEVDVFQPVTITLETESELADFVGAVGAYGKGVLKAKKTIREAGLLDSYSGNARKFARELVKELAEEVGFPYPNIDRPAPVVPAPRPRYW